MSEFVIINTGLYGETNQMAEAIALLSPEQVKHIHIDVNRMGEQDWNTVLEDVLNSKTVITV